MGAKIARITFILLTVFIILLIVISIFSQTNYFRNFVIDAAEGTFHAATRQMLTIGKVEGNLITGLKLKNVKLFIENEPLFTVNEITVKYSFLMFLDATALLSSVLPLKNISCDDIYINIVKDAHGKWNYEKLARKNYFKKKKKSKRRKGWSFIFNSTFVKRAKIRIYDEASKREDIYYVENAAFSIKLINKLTTGEIDLDRGDVYIGSKKHKIHFDKTRVRYLSKTFFIQESQFVYEETTYKIQGSVAGFESPEFKLSAIVEGLDITEGKLNFKVTDAIGKFDISAGFEAKANFELLDSEILGQTVSGKSADIKIKGYAAEVENGKLFSGSGVIDVQGEADFTYLFTGKGVNSFHSNLIVKDLPAKAIGHTVQGWPDGTITAANIDLSGEWKKNLDEIDLHAIVNDYSQKGEFGEARLTGTLEWANPNLTYDVNGTLHDGRMDLIFKDERFDAQLNTDVRVKGRIIIQDEIPVIELNASGDIKPSRIASLEVSEGYFDIDYTLDEIRDNIKVNAISIKSPQLFLKSYTLESDDKLYFDIDMENAAILTHYFPDIELKGAITGSGSIEGSLDAPRLEFNVKGSLLQYKDFRAHSADISGYVSIMDENLDLNVKANAKTFYYKNSRYETFTIEAFTHDSSIIGKVYGVQSANNDLLSEFTISGLEDEVKQVDITKIRLTVKGGVLQNKSPIQLTISENKLTAKSINLYFKDNYAVGYADINYNGAIDVNFKLKDITLKEITEAFLPPSTTIEGDATGELNISGNFDNPVINLDLSIDNFLFVDLKSQSAKLNLSYTKRKLNLGIDLFEPQGESLTLRASSNVDLNFNDITKSFESASFKSAIKSKGFNISPIANLSDEIKYVDGKGAIDLTAEGMLAHPKVRGYIKLQDVDIKFRSLRNIITVNSGELRFDGDNGYLESFEVTTDQGSGFLEGEINLVDLSYNFKVRLDKFRLKPRGISIYIQGVINVAGNADRTDITGDIKITSAKIRLPDLPDKDIEEIKFIGEEEPEFMIEDTKKSDYFRESVFMDMKISTPGNVWLKGQGANIELKGNVRLYKEPGSDLTVMGNDISIVRGTYEIFSKLFFLEEGKVSFRGEPDINPFLDVRAVHIVSNVTIIINVTGTRKRPVITLSSDPTMDQTDIFSYLAFGTAAQNLGPGQRASLQGKVAEVIGYMAAGKLKEVVGEKFGLDVITITGGEKEFSGSQIEVGKYLFDFLYVAYERGVKQTDISADAIMQNNVKVELRLFDFLTIESKVGGVESGGDIFFNINY